MKIVTSYKLRVTFFLLSAFCFLLSALNAQIEIKELNLTPEMEEMLIAKIKNLPEFYTTHGIKNLPQFENLHLGKPIPLYNIVSKKLNRPISTFYVSRMSDGDSLSLEFTNSWNLPVMCDGTPFLFSVSFFPPWKPELMVDITKGRMEQFSNYEHKDSIMGSIAVTSSMPGMDHFIIRKENQDIFVEIYDEVTGECFKNEYRLGELMNHIKELAQREKEAQMRYYAQIADKSELTLTPELTEMLVNNAYSSHIDASDWLLSNHGIKDRAQLEHLHLGKPIPRYRIVNENLTFEGYWNVPVMSNGEPLFFTTVKLDDEYQYKWVGEAGGNKAEIIYNYEYKDLIVGCLGRFHPGMDYLIIRKDNQDIFVKMYDYETEEYLKNEHSFNEVLNFLKK
jgi:hypothetical protein